MRNARHRRFGTGWAGAAVLLVIAVPCLVTLSVSLDKYEGEAGDELAAHQAPNWSQPMGTDALGRSLLWRCLLGGAISLGIGASAALISVIIGVSWGAVAGYVGGRTDAVMMRAVDILYGLPYVLLVVLLAVAVDGAVSHYRKQQNQVKARIEAQYQAALAEAKTIRATADSVPATAERTELVLRAAALESQAAGLRYDKPPLMSFVETREGLIRVLTLLVAIGTVSWLTMARVIRGQVLSLRAQPFIEAARACGVPSRRILWRHLLPNLVGPIVVYTTLTVPSAILQESFLSFLGIGVQAPMPSWGNLAAEGMNELHALGIPGQQVRWWLIVWPCTLLGLTLLSLNFLGDALRQWLDPRSHESR